MKKLLSLILCLALALGLSGVAFAEDAPLAGKLVILHTNDIHGRAVADPKNGAMGYAEIAQFKKDVAALGAQVLLVDAGDATQGMPLVDLSQGAVAIDFMNAAKYDMMSLGNHEFDHGADNAMKLADQAEFPVLCANVVRSADGTLPFQANLTVETEGGVKIGIFGLLTPETATKTNPMLVAGYDFLQNEALYAAAQAQVDELRAEGCALVICIGHLGVEDESVGNRSLDVIANTSGIDLFIDGHSHTLMNGEQIDSLNEGKTLLVQTGCYSANLGAIIFDGEALKNGMIPARAYEGNVAALCALVPVHQDEEVAALVNGVNDKIQAQLSEVFAQTEYDLNGERAPGVRTEETNLGDFCTDAMLWSARQSCGDQVVAAITNGGGIRATIAAGDISMNDMKTVFPYGNTVVTLQVTGAELLEAIEAATFSTPDAIGAFPQVSGIEYTIDTTVPYEAGEDYPGTTYAQPAKPGSRVTIATVGGAPFDLEALYTIATNDFTAVGGDTYYVFRYPHQQTGYDTGVLLDTALVNYVREVLGGTVGEQYAAPQGRITVILPEVEEELEPAA